LLDNRQSSATRDSVENERLVRVSRSLHAFWRKTVRMPWRTLRRRLRGAMAASEAGIPVTVDETTELKSVPYEARFPPPLAQCTVVEPCEYRTRLHPLSVNSTTSEAMHYVGHIVHAPPMTLEHLVDQYWFPALGLLISESATRSSGPSRRIFFHRSRRSSTGRRRTEPANIASSSSGSPARRGYRARVS
jgi:hypothetical protein